MSEKLIVIYTRASEGEEGGQDIVAQEVQGVQDAEAEGFRVIGAFRDDGVKGSVPPVERPGFQEALQLAQTAGADLGMRDWARFSRQNPADAGVALLDCPCHVHVFRDNPIQEQTREAQEEQPMSAGMSFFGFFGPWQYRAAAVKAGRNNAEAYRTKAKETKSGLPPHRPIKISDEEARRAWDKMQAEDWSLRQVASWLSEERGAMASGIEAKERRRRMVSHKAVGAAFERCGLGQKPVRDESVSSQGMGGQGRKGALSPGAGSDAASETLLGPEKRLREGKGSVADTEIRGDSS